MPLKQVSSYQTTDGQLFTDRAEALTHDLAIEIRGIVQSDHIGRAPVINATDVGKFVAAYHESLFKMLSDYRIKIRRMKPTPKKAVAKLPA